MGKEYSEIGARLRRLRQGFSKSSQKDWAEKNGFNATQYNNWEIGLRLIPVHAAICLCDRYGLTLDAIYRGHIDGVSQTARDALIRPQ
jgi:transcriptional regulator with XRE-family HTH domain